MAYPSVFIAIIAIFGLYLFYNSYYFQVLLRKHRSKNNFVNEFRERVKGKFYGKGYFNTHSEFITSGEYVSLKKRSKVDYRSCYNAVSFRTPDADWEMFFVLERDGIKYREQVILRAFPHHMRIKSEGTAEKSLSRLSVYSNNKYLSGIIESSDMHDMFHTILKENGDIMHIYHNNLYTNLIVNPHVTVDFAMEVIKDMNIIKNKVYRRGIMEY